MSRPIAILTDFGTADPFVGIMKGVIAGIAPDSIIIDLTHAIPPGDIQRGAVTLWQSLPYFPKDSVFLAVVDPGVGTQRRPIVVEVEGSTFIGPDNGLFSFVLGNSFQAWELQNPRLALSNPGMTFHGRDIFAPAAAHAALGTRGSDFGELIQEIKRLPFPRLEIPIPGEIHGQILHADRFGNLLTSLGTFTPAEGGKLKFSSWIGSRVEIEIDAQRTSLHLPDGKSLQRAETFDQIPESECAYILGSSGLLEIAANRKSAAALLNLAGGEFITLSYIETVNQE